MTKRSFKAHLLGMLTTLVVLSFLPISLSAQFIGELTVDYVNVDNDETVTFTVLLTPTRIVATSSGNGDIKAPGPMQNAGKVFIRLDEEDFVMLDESEKQAVSIPKKQIESMVNMAAMMKQQQGGGQAKNKNKVEISYDYTGQKEEMLGYTASEMRFMDSSKEETLDVWVTDEVPVYWGMLAQKWNFMGDMAQFNQTDWLKNGTLPMLVEFNENGKPSAYLKVKNITKRNISDTEVNVPEGIKIMSTQDMMLNQFRNGARSGN